MNGNIAIKIENVKKRYRLGQIGGGTLQGDLQTWWARKRGKEDPNSIIGSDQRLIGQTFMALNGINLEIKKGESVGIIGRNGAGKSTLLKLLSRVTAPTEGTIDIYGRITSMLEVGTGFHGEMTGRENVYMNGSILGMTKSEIDKKMGQIIEFSEVGDFIDTPVKRYSSGMYVKLAFSVAAHLNSEIMIMDEVLAVGDMAFQQKCLDKMSDASRTEGKTVLYVSHNMNTIRKLCTRCIVLDEGKIIYDGNVDKAISIYMNCDDNRKTSYDFSNIKRSPNESRKLEMLKIDILDRKENIININEELHFRLYTKVNSRFDSLGFRLELFYSDKTIAGTAFSDKFIQCGDSQYINVDYSLNVRNFAPGQYYAVALLFERDSYGNQVGVDRVEPAMYFEIIASEELIWLHQYWGHVKFDDLVTIKKENY